MKAAVFYGKRDIRIENVDDPVLEPDSVIIKVRLCGICGSDLHHYRGKERTESGIIMGHEFSGDVVEVGAKVTGIKKGDRVAAAGYKACGECHWCQKAMPGRCSAVKIIGIDFDGGFAEYVSIPNAVLNRTVFPISDEMSYEDGALVEPFSVGVNAAKRAEPEPQCIAVVLGAGTIGQCVMQSLKAMGVGRVIVTDIGRKRLEVARATGADTVIDAAKEDALGIVEEATSGKGADIVAECVGLEATFHQALKMVRSNGRIVIVGLYEKPLRWDPNELTNRSVRMIGCFAGSFPRALELIQSGKVNARALVTHVFPLEKAKEAFEAQLDTEKTVKVLIEA